MTPDAETAGFTPSAPACGAWLSSMAKASRTAEQVCAIQLDMGHSVIVNASVRCLSLRAGFARLKCRCGIGSMAVGYEPARQQGAQQQRDADAHHAGGP